MRSVAQSRKRRSPIGTDPLAAIIPIDTAASAESFDEPDPAADMTAEPAAVMAAVPAMSPAPAEPASKPGPAVPWQAVAPVQRQEPPRLASAAPAPAMVEAPPPAPQSVSMRPSMLTHGPALDEDPAQLRKKVRTTLNMDPELNEAMRNTVFALSGPEVQMTLVRFVEEAIAAHLATLQREYNGGKPFPARRGALRTGRPLT